jgi:ATP:ADP antiporter, AAA family
MKAALTLLFDIKSGERKKTLLLFSWLMLFISAYYVLRPIRRALVLDGLGNEAMPFIYLGTALVTGLVVWIYSKFSHLPRKLLIGSIYGIFASHLLCWWMLFQFETPAMYGVFWVWLDVFSIMGVTLFWMYANDIFESSSAGRLFGIIAAGGGMGAIVGSSITAGLVESLGVNSMLLVSSVIVATILAIFLKLESIVSKDTIVSKDKIDRPDIHAEKKSSKSLREILSDIKNNRFLLLLTIVVCFERITPDLIQYLYHEILDQIVSGRSAIAAMDANLERWRGIVEICIELFVVAFIIRKFGSGFSLVSNGLAIAGSLAAFALFANPLIIVAIFHADEAMRHSWFKAAKELTYTVTNRQILYAVKPVIEMFFYRFSRGLAGLLILFVAGIMGLGTSGILALGIVTGLLWAYFAWQLYGEFRKREYLAMIIDLQTIAKAENSYAASAGPR